MKRLVATTLLCAAVFVGAASTWSPAPAQACEKHLDGHQNSSDSSSEGAKK
ncbi:hypothetical protein KBY58_10050 [Cyanobium sp. HWJ4-Hawea]|uniref:hypothetical protein n=1 Tax=Cyanobium sp. HWJ4-Hawea TaxID=2823713 RepID=UPI0020CC42BC|nr:hypothetical protein [Cyanobium sp. HWJ4-Hawea]MCP9809775.1 hypothetical protein [Cyanobium sp. HWJ4-Hawea]